MKHFASSSQGKSRLCYAMRKRSDRDVADLCFERTQSEFAW